MCDKLLINIKKINFNKIIEEGFENIYAHPGDPDSDLRDTTEDLHNIIVDSCGLVDDTNVDYDYGLLLDDYNVYTENCSNDYYLLKIINTIRDEDLPEYKQKWSIKKVNKDYVYSFTGKVIDDEYKLFDYMNVLPSQRQLVFIDVIDKVRNLNLSDNDECSFEVFGLY